ncbi:hypothetical protein DFH06DRAFT_1322589 [Mycena polygramma]|nr:hypothetical protein DFH06DRAFT_1322589 [Mycena polygramma]
MFLAPGSRSSSIPSYRRQVRLRGNGEASCFNVDTPRREPQVRGLDPLTATPRTPQASLRTAALVRLIELVFKSPRLAPPCVP